MAHVHAASDAERLPWLTDDKTVRKSDSPPLLPWALTAVVLVAGVSYWFGMSSPSGVSEPVDDRPPAATITLPKPAERAPADEVRPAPMREVQPAPQPTVALPRFEPVRETARPVRSRRRLLRPHKLPDSLSTVVKEQSSKPKAKPAARKTLPVWPAMVSKGASGRMVRLGTFATRYQAKRGWRQIVRLYPGLTRLPAAVVPVQSMRNGRTYYRLQMGTTSHAHSTVLCQRMRIIGQGCVVVGVAEAVEKQGPVGL